MGYDVAEVRATATVAGFYPLHVNERLTYREAFALAYATGLPFSRAAGAVVVYTAAGAIIGARAGWPRWWRYLPKTAILAELPLN